LSVRWEIKDGIGEGGVCHLGVEPFPVGESKGRISIRGKGVAWDAPVQRPILDNAHLSLTSNVVTSISVDVEIKGKNQMAAC
jgi:hypothetical protein